MTVATASVVAIVLGAGVVSATAVERRVAGEERRALAAGAQVHELAAAPTTVAAPAPASPGTAPPTTVAPVGTELPTTTMARRRQTSPGPVTTVATKPPESTTVVTSPPATLDPWAGVDRHFQPGRTSWSTSGAGWSISARIDNPTPFSGQPVRFDFEISTTVDPCCGISVFFDSAPSYSARSGGTCPVSEPRPPGSARFSTTVVFQGLGWQRFNVVANTGSCGLDPPRSSLVGEVDVKPRSLSFQGPEPPVLGLSETYVQGHRGDRTWLGVFGDARDYDGGRIRSVTIDWGDGSPASHPSEPPPPACRVQPDGSMVADWMTFDTVPHHYSAPGTYVVTVTAVSTACDGISMPQSGSRSFTWSI